MMSDHDDTLLDEDLGDEEYDLGNDEEEALLADDYEFERLPVQQTICKGEEETDDVLDLGVTDALDDLEAEEENVQSKTKNDKPQGDELHIKEQDENLLAQDKREQIISQESQDHQLEHHSEYQSKHQSEYHSEEEPEVPIVQPKVDLREKLREKSNNHREVFTRNGQGIEDDECEEAKERRNRFQSERIMIPPKMNHDIPDSLENVVTTEQHRPHYRNRDRGERGDRGDRSERNDRSDRSDRVDRVDRGDRSERSDRGDRRSVRGRTGGRYDAHQCGRYHHGHAAASNPQPAFRTSLLENRTSFQTGPSNNIPIQQHHQIYQHHNSQAQPPYHHPLPNGPMPGHPHFIDSRLPMLSNQFPEPMRPQGPRMNPPRVEYSPRGPPTGPPGIPVHPSGPPGPSGHPPVLPGPPGVSGPSGPGPAYNCPPNQAPFGPNQGLFPNHAMHMPERGPPHPGNQGPLLPIMSGPGGSHIPGNQGTMIPVTQGLPGQGFRSQVPNQPSTHQSHSNAPSQSVYESRIQYSDSQFEGHASFDVRNSYNNPPVSQYNNTAPQIVRPITQTAPQQILMGITNVPGMSNMSNVPTIPTGHKILINPHFRGNPTKSEAKTIQDPADKFVQALRNASNSNSRDNRPNNQQAKSDDPYSYFSDVWQETKTQRSQNSNSRRSYSPDINYSKSSSYNSYDNKYKSESQWSHRDGHLEEHRSSRDAYREREASPRSRNEQKNYLASPNNSSHRNETHDHSSVKTGSQKIENSKLANSPAKEPHRTSQKRSGEDNSDRNTKENSPKRLRPNLRHTLNAEKLSEKSMKKEEEMDPEMREYRKKMEEQKRLREKILREKENRRKLAAMEKQNSQTTDSSNTENVKQEIPLTTLVKENTKGKINLTGVVRGRGRLINMQSAEEKVVPVRVVRTVQTKHHKDQLKIVNNDDYEENDDDDGGKSDLLSRIVLNKTKNAQKTLLHKSNTQNSQKAAVTQAVNASRQLGQIRQLLTNSQRIVVQNTQQKHIATQDQQRQRIVIHKPSSHETKKSIKSNVVKVDNLAASTTEAQIRRMCQGIGSIESIRMGEGNATIVFKTQSAAMVFHKKYQRKMLDLSLIKVQLVPQTAKISAVLLKSTAKD